ncbi:MAG: hypothetical protein ACHQNT_06265 [Bacteroidia bacterium]
MKSTLLFLLCFVVVAPSQGQSKKKGKQYIVNDKNDTLYYSKVNSALGFKVTGHKSSGDKIQYDGQNVKFFHNEYALYEVVSEEKINGWNKRNDFLIVMLRNKENARILASSQMTMNGGYNYYYYYFDKSGFKGKVDDDNIKEIIASNFSGCPAFDNEIKDLSGKKIIKKFDELSPVYQKKCQ